MLLFRLENQFIAMNNLLSDVEIHRHVSKREVEEQNHVNKRNAENDDEEVSRLFLDKTFNLSILIKISKRP